MALTKQEKWNYGLALGAMGALVLGAVFMRPRRDDLALRATLERERLFPRQRKTEHEEILSDEPGRSIVQLYGRGPMIQSTAQDVATARLRAAELRREVMACGRSDFEEVDQSQSGKILIRLGDKEAFSVSGRTLQEALAKIDEERDLVAKGYGKRAALEKLRARTKK